MWSGGTSNLRVETPTPGVVKGADLCVCVCVARWYTGERGGTVTLFLSAPRFTEFTNEITEQTFAVKRMASKLVASVTITLNSLQGRGVCTLVVILECCLTANIDSVMITISEHYRTNTHK